jgi:SAM-dependent methyltransferase
MEPLDPAGEALLLEWIEKADADLEVARLSGTTRGQVSGPSYYAGRMSRDQDPQPPAPGDDPLPDPPASGPRRSRRPEDFELSYAETPPWDIGRPQPAFLALAESGALQGRVLDVGCGTGEHAIMAASLGLDATGIDSAPTAISLGQAKARERGVAVRFLVWNALKLASLGGQFDTVLDSGLFHVFDDDDRRSFVESLRAGIKTGGRYFMLCFSDRQPGDWGPRRITQDDIRTSFDKGWQVESIDAVTLDTRMGPEGVLGWLASITRT